MSGDVVIGDWGNTRLRLWRLEDGLAAERREGLGIAQTSNPAVALAATIDGWNAMSIVLCGMAGARNGLREAPYLPCPADVHGWASRTMEFDLDGARVVIAPGLVSAGVRPDVMRGEETQVFGAMAGNPELSSGSHCVVLPGTHSKWVQLVDGSIESFRTFMTGELFDLLQRSSLFAAGSETRDLDVEIGFSDGIARSGALSSLLFEARSAQLVDGKSAGWARGFVSGVLIGAEVAAMKPEGSVTVIAEPAIADRYRRAFAPYRVDLRILDAEKCAVAGLRLLDADA